MPTGYTAPIYDNEPTTFAEFTWRCARGFGALMHMREEPMGSPTLSQALAGFGSSDDYCVKRLEQAKRDLACLEAMTPDEMRTAMTSEAARAEADHAKSVADHAAKRERYQAMLDQVRDWQPPTEDHEGLHKFMINQLEESIRWDAYEPAPPHLPTDLDEYRRHRIEFAQRSVAMAETDLQNERERAAKRREWVLALHTSVPCPRNE